MKIIVEECRKHVHLSEGITKYLFGDTLEVRTPRKVLSVCAYFASMARLEVAQTGMKLTVVGPPRDYSQIELSEPEYVELFGETEHRRASGVLKGARECVVIGPGGKTASIPVIIPEPHIHISPFYKVFTGGPENTEGFVRCGDRWDYQLKLDSGAVALTCPVYWHHTHEGNGYVHLDSQLFSFWSKFHEDNTIEG